MTRRDYVFIGVICLVVSLAVAVQIVPSVTAGGKDAAVVDVPVDTGPVDRPNREWIAKVATIRTAMEGRENAVDVGWFFYHLADAAEELKTKRELVSFNGEIAERLELVGGELQTPEIVDKVEAVLLEAIRSDEPGRLTEADRRDWEQGCHAIAWACFDGRDAGKSRDRFGKVALEIAERIAARRPLRPLRPMADAGEYSPRPCDAHGSGTKSGLIMSGVSKDSEHAKRPVLSKKKDAANASDLPRWQTNSLTVDPGLHKRFLQRSQRFRNLFKGGQTIGQTRLLYRAPRIFDRDIFDDDAQTTGDCVSHATANACSTVSACQILVEGEPFRWVARAATEPIYGHRGHGGEGMSVERAADFISSVGGVPLRKDYGRYDFSRYNARTGTKWGSTGVPEDLLRQLRQNQMLHTALVLTTDEARDAIANCFPIVVGSNASFTFSRDSHGFARRNGPCTPNLPRCENRDGWAHAMAWLAVSTAETLAGDDWERYGRSPDSPCFLVVNSWGDHWISGPRGRFDIPKGSFWITSSEAAFMLSQRMAIAVGDFEGFELPPIDNLGFQFLADPNVSFRGPPELTGAIAIAIAKAVSGSEDPTQIEAAEETVIDEDDTDDDRGRRCRRCNGSGTVTFPDGNSGPCDCAAGLSIEVAKLKEDLQKLVNVRNDASSNKPKQRTMQTWDSMAKMISSANDGTFYLIFGVEGCSSCVAMMDEVSERLKMGEPMHVGYVDVLKNSKAKTALGKRLCPSVMRIIKTTDGKRSSSWLPEIPR